MGYWQPVMVLDVDLQEASLESLQTACCDVDPSELARYYLSNKSDLTTSEQSGNFHTGEAGIEVVLTSQMGCVQTATRVIPIFGHLAPSAFCPLYQAQVPVRSQPDQSKGKGKGKGKGKAEAANKADVYVAENPLEGSEQEPGTCMIHQQRDHWITRRLESHEPWTG